MSSPTLPVHPFRTHTALPPAPLCLMQHEAAACLARYARVHHIDHPGLDALIAHLRAYPDADATLSLSQWDQIGSQLQIRGRGDPLPAPLLSQIAPDKHTALEQLVDACVEVGIVDLYGARTDLPAQMLARAKAILQECASDLC